tara:strand:- start:8504 stop:9313 length:810 start_codon:yes stop_codon:yes gene_type:complete
VSRVPLYEVFTKDYDLGFYLADPTIGLLMKVESDGNDVIISKESTFDSEVVSVKQVEDRQLKQKQNYQAAIYAWGQTWATINVNYAFLMKSGPSGLQGSNFPIYILMDGGELAIMTYDYFWDPDPKFQSTFRDNMGGNHQWLFYWYNMGGRSGIADIQEASANRISYPMIVHLWKSDKWPELLKFVSQNCRSRPVPEFSRAHSYARDRIMVHLEEQEDDDKDHESAYMYAMQDMESARKRKDTAAWYPEYEEMGFDHPRPDFKDPKWKL